VYRPSSGVWFILQSSSNFMVFTMRQWGASADTVVPGDYDGDGKTDLAVFRPSTRTCHLLYSNANYTTSASYPWGANTDIPIVYPP
jgi:hypothetical protein